MSPILGSSAAALAALALAAAPAAAAQNAASKLSLRAATESERSEQLAGAPLIAVIGVAAIVAGGVIIATDDEDEPDSN